MKTWLSIWLLVLVCLTFSFCLVGCTASPATASPDLDVDLGGKKPDPAAKAVRAVICTQLGCAPCAKMKRDLAGKQFPFTVEWASTRDKQYKAKAAPTTIKFVDGKEVDRKEGYLSADELAAWMKQ